MPLSRLENILIGIDLKEGYTRLTKREKNIINLLSRHTCNVALIGIY